MSCSLRGIGGSVAEASRGAPRSSFRSTRAGSLPAGDRGSHKRGYKASRRKRSSVRWRSTTPGSRHTPKHQPCQIRACRAVVIRRRGTPRSIFLEERRVEARCRGAARLARIWSRLADSENGDDVRGSCSSQRSAKWRRGRACLASPAPQASGLRSSPQVQRQNTPSPEFGAQESHGSSSHSIPSPLRC